MFFRSMLSANFHITQAFLACLFLLSQPAVAGQFIQSGYWAIDGEAGPGSGVNINVQNNRLAITVLTYDNSGNATWFVSNGSLVNQGQSLPSYTGDLLSAVSGTRIDREGFSPAQFVDSGDDVNIIFDGTTTGLIEINGVEKRIRYLQFAGKSDVIPGELDQEYSNQLPDLEGEWLFVFRSAGLATNTRLFQFQRISTGEDNDTDIIYQHTDNSISSASFICETVASNSFAPGGNTTLVPFCVLQVNESERISQYIFSPNDISANRIDLAPTSFEAIPTEPIEVFLIRLGNI